MYSKIHELLVELTVYHNDWGHADFIRRRIVVMLGIISDILR